VPGIPARDGADDVGERYLDSLAGEIEAGREDAPPEEEPAPAAQAVQDVASLDDDELLSVILAARRRQARDEYEELAAIAEFTRRREAQHE
jgi:hypothetical protein